MNISFNIANETLHYAAEELKKYLLIMDPTLSDTVNIQFLIKQYPDIDPMLDDVIEIDIQQMSGTICGSNGRSVLMGVYTLLKSAGCMWVRPGKLGEHIPKKLMKDYSFRYEHKADLPFRGECIEGSVSLENVLDTIEWLPKVNANLFMIQFIVPYGMFTRWYEHQDNPYKEPEDFSYEKGREHVCIIEREIKRRGLQLHSVGHGYIYEPYGLPYRKRSDTYHPSEEAVSAMAMINGKRGFFKLVPNHTQPCLSQASVRKKITDWLVQYIEKKPEIDFLHIWLADSRNNHCECEECRKKIPSDFYVTFLNDLDAALTANGSDTKIVFILYTDTYWAPKTVGLNNPDRFIMTVAATARDYNLPFQNDRYKQELPAYNRNNNTFSVTMPMTLAFMDEWKKVFNGKRFLFDYRLYMEHYSDPSYMNLTEELHKDACSIGSIGFDGIMQCKTQRSSFPIALPMAVYSETLFDNTLDLEKYTDLYFENTFGSDGPKVKSYLEELRRIFDPIKLRVRDDIVVLDTGTGGTLSHQGFAKNPETVARLSAVARCLNSFKKTIEKNLNAKDACVRESWRLLKLHQTFCTLYADVLSAYGEGDQTLIVQKTELMKDWLGRLEDEYQPYFDLVLFVQKLDRMMK